jgi:hypothetical protein
VSGPRRITLPDLPEPYFWRIVEVSSGPAVIRAQIVYPRGRRGKRLGVWGETPPMEAVYTSALESNAATLKRSLLSVRVNREIANDLVGEYRRKL